MGFRAIARASSLLHALLWFWVLLGPVALLAGARNITIDDEGGDEVTHAPVQYSKVGWTQGASCATCWSRPDASQAYDHTWHDSTANITTPNSVALNFTGTAIYAYIILTNNIHDGTAPTHTHIGISLDGNSSFPPFTHESDGTNEFVYNQLAFSQTGLNNGLHSLNLTSTALSADKSSVMLFDYAVYTVADNTASFSSSSSTAPSQTSSSSQTPAASQTSAPSQAFAHTHRHVGTIIGAVIGSVVAVLAALGIVYYLRRKWRADTGLQDFLTKVQDTKESTSPGNSPAQSAQSLSRNPPLDRYPDPAWAPQQDSPYSPAPNVFVPLKQQRVRSLPIPPVPAADTQLRERVNVLEAQISQLATTGAPVASDEPPPAYGSPRTVATRVMKRL